MLPGCYSEYKVFLEDVTSDNTEDLTCLRVLPYKISQAELQPEIINQITNYLSDKRCPTKLYYKIVKNTSNAILNELKKSPYSCGFDDNEMNYESTKLQVLTISHLKSYCNRLLDNIELNNILPASLVKNIDEIDGNAPTDDLPKHIVCATKNRRRYMEDRHTCMEQLNNIYNIQTNKRASFYAVYDGHAGHAAATYSASHFPYNLANNENYPSDPEKAMREAFYKTENGFMSKQIDGGATAVCALYLPDELSLYVGWVGDSRAMLAREGSIFQIVKAHRPTDPSECERIEMSGGTVMMWGGELRVNGIMNITRAIGDRSCKPFIICEPDILKLNLNTKEDFLVLGCDGLWDHVEDKVIAESIYQLLHQDCDNLDRIPKHLIDLAKKGFSSDNITIIIVFFKHPSKIQRPTEIMESPTFDSFDVAAVKIEASEECSNNANNTDFNNLCWLKKDNQDQVDDVLMAAEQKYQFNDDLNNILDPSLIKAHNQDGDEQEHVNLNNQNNLPCIKELNGAEGNNDHEIENDINTENNHNLDETENDKNNLVSFDDFGPETSVDEIAVPEEKLSEHEELVPMETTTSSSPSIEVTTNTFDELIFQEKAEEVIITPSSDLDDDSVDKQLSSVDNTNTLSEVDEEVPEKMVFEHDEDDILKSPVKQHVEEDILKSPESEPSIDQNIIVEEQSFIANSEHNFELEEAKFDHEVDVQVDDVGVVADNADIDDNKNIFTDEQHFESTMNDSKANIVESAVQQPVQDSCDESDEEWNYMKAKEGQTEKENNVLSEEFKENIEPVTEKEFSSVELKEQLDTTPEPVAICDPVVAEIPATPELVSPVVVDDLQTTPDMMMDENNFHLNPEAKEFVPNTYASPTHEEAEQQNGEVDTLQVKQPYRHVFDDVVSQSPRKGRESNMDDFLLPAENDFDVEIANRPHELLQEEVKMEEGEEKEVEEPQNENELLIQNALDNVGMKDSLYVENTSSGFNNGEVDLLNTIQPLPEVEVEENNVLSNKEGLSLEIDEKDVISPSSEDIKEIVTEIEEKVKEMNIVEEPLVSPPEIEVSQPEPTMDVSAEISQSVFEITPPVFEISQNNFEEELKQVEETKPIEESAPVQEELKPVEEIKPEEVKLTEEPKPVEETPTFNGEINVEELNKKNLEESAKLDAPVDNVPVEEAPVKIEESKLLEATLGVVAVTAAATATIKASSAKKSPATKPATLSAAKKPTTTTTARKLGTSSTTATPAAARPKTAPVKSTIERKPTATRTTTVTAAKPRIDIKKTTTTTSTLSKPKEVTKTTEIKKTTTTTSARSTVPKATSATAARPRPTTASSLTNGISKTSTASRTSSTTSSTLKPTTTSAAAPKPRLSPRSTVSSTLRKAETLKSPSATKAAPSSSRIDSGLKNGKPATCPAKPSTLRATKPAMGTVSTPSNRLTVKSTITTTSSQRKTASPLDKKKTLAPATTLNSARKSLSLTKTPIKSPGAKPIQKPVQAEPVVIEVAQEVVAAPSPPEAAAVAVDVPIA